MGGGGGREERKTDRQADKHADKQKKDRERGIKEAEISRIIT